MAMEHRLCLALARLGQAQTRGQKLGNAHPYFMHVQPPKVGLALPRLTLEHPLAASSGRQLQGQKS